MSSNKLVAAMQPATPRKPRVTITENGALTNASTFNAVLDFFSKSGALRGNHNQFVKMFADAYAEDPQLAVRALFQARDIRGGNGERKNFREAMRWLGTEYPLVFGKVFQHVPEYGRWDDLFEFLTPEIKDFICKQFYKDLLAADRGEPISLLAKWLPSENASSEESKRLARYFADKLKLHARDYRKALSRMRRAIRLVETKMSQNEWSSIQYDKVPSQASRIYRKAFGKHDQERYAEYIQAAKRGEKKINASTLTPYQIVSQVETRPDETLEALWNQLPNYMNDASMIVVADTSGSMSGMPLWIAVSLAIYAAERNKGPFRNCWINFSTSPTWQVLRGASLRDKLRNMDRHNWHASTDVEKVFRMILSTAVKGNVPQEDMPKIVTIISDMQFNEGIGKRTFTNHEAIAAMYRNAGYEMPVLVYWNVRASNGQPVTKDTTGTILVSGESPSAFKALMSCDVEKLRGATPLSHMLEVLNSERYAQITL